MPSLPRPLLVMVACILLLPLAAPLLSGGPLPPYLVLHSPSNGDVVSGDVTVTFTSSDTFPHRVDLYVDGDLTQTSISSPHTVSGLADGNRTITLVAINDQDSYITKSATILMDSTPPVVDIIHPEEGQVLDDRSFSLNYTVEEENPSRTQYRIDDGSWTSLSGNLTVDLSHDGNYSITVRAIDTAGNSGTKVVNFSVDTGMPVIRFISPEHNSYHNVSDVTVNWTAYNYDHLNYSLDGGPWTPAPADGVNLSGLDNGRHTIILRGSNSNGIDERSLSFYVDVDLPSLTIMAPLPDMRFGTGSVMAIWDVVNESPYHSDITVTVGAFTRQHNGISGTSLRMTDLPAGDAVMDITVTDRAGNSMTANVSFRVGVQGLPLGAISVSNDDSLESLVRHLALPGNGTADDPYVFDNIGIDAQGAYHAVKVEHTSKHMVFSNLSLFNTLTVNSEPAGAGLLLKDTKNILVRDCVIIGQMYGVRSDSISHNLTVTGNDLRDSERGAVTVEQGYNLTITDNDCREAGRWGIKAGWELTESKDVNVSGNDCRDHQRYGVAVERINGGNVDNNSVSTSADHDTIGIYLYNSATDTTIRDNDCRYNHQGILLTGGAYRNTIADNDCRNNTHGIEVSDWSERNNITGNDCRENPYGIYLYNAWYNNVESNNCTQNNNSLGVGVFVQGGSDNVIQTNNVSGNLIGIYVHQSSYQRILENDCRDAGEYAILVEGRPYGHRIVDNDCRFATLDAIRMEADFWNVSYNTVEGNDCRDNGGSGLNISTASQYAVQHNLITGNDLRSSTFDLIRIEGGDHIHNRFIGNLLSEAPMMPINLVSSSLIFNNITVQGNQMQNSSTDAFRLYGDLEHLYILDNVAHNASGDGMNVTDPNQGMEEVHIDGNDVSDAGGDAIYLWGDSVDGGSVSSNTVLRPSGLPIQVLSAGLSAFNIDDNTAHGHPSRPITVTALALEEVSISGNDLRDSGEGILLQDRQFLNITVSRNDLRGTPGTLIELSSPDSVSGMHVDGNDLRRDNGRGILVDVNGISASSFNDNLLQLLLDEPLTIHSPYLHDVTVDGNICPAATDNGLFLNASEVRGLSVSGNDLNTSGGDGLRLVFTTVDGLSVRDNHIDDSDGNGIIVSASYIDGLEVGGNSVNRSGDDSISVTAATSLSNVLVEENHCNASSYPLLLRAGTMFNVTVHANTIHDPQTRPLLLDTDHLDGITVSDNIARDSPDHGVEMNGTFVNDIVISGNELGGSALVPIQVTSPNPISSIRVEGNNASGLDDHGILIEAPTLNDVAVDGNTLIGNLAEQIVLRCDSLKDATVAENLAPNSPLIPLLLDCDSVNGLTIRDNVFNDSGGHGIHVGVVSCVDVAISGNLLHGSALDAVNVTVVNDAVNVTVEGNDCSDAGGNALTITADGLQQILVHDNLMTDVGLDPIFFSASSSLDVTITNNSCPDARGTPVMLSITEIVGLTINGNDFDRSGSHGVAVEASLLSHITVTDNSVVNAMGDGIRVAMTSPGVMRSVIIVDNDVRDAAGNAINLSAESLDLVAINGNDLRNAGADAVRATSQNIITNLTIEDNDCRLAATNGINITASSHIQDFSIAANDITLVGINAIVIDAPLIANGSIEENLCQDALRPLVLEAETVTHLRIALNNLSGSGGEALRIDAAVDILDVIGNDMTGSLLGAVVINVDGDGTSIAIRDNTIGAIGHGIRIDAGNLSSTLIGNNTVTVTGNPLWISADGSVSMRIIDNDCSAATALPLRLDIPLLEDTLIEGNDISGSTAGIEVHSNTLVDTRILRNDLSDCGSGINISAVGTISSIQISENNMTGVLGDAIVLHSDTSMQDVEIIANHGDAEGILVSSPSLQHGNVSHNQLQGPITVDVSNTLLLGSMDGNVITEGISLNASDLSVLSISENNATHLHLNSTGDVLVGSVNGNTLPGGITVVATGGCAVTTMDDNTVGSTVVVADSLSLGSFSRNDITPADDALSISAGIVTVGNITSNTINNCSHTVFSFNATVLDVDAVDSNTLLSGSPQHLIHVVADTAVIASMSSNVMMSPSTSAAVLMVCGTGLDAVITDNDLDGAVDLSSDALLVTFDGNTVNGTLTVIADNVTMPSLNGNTMHHVHINGSASVQMVTISDNLLVNLNISSSGAVDLNSVTLNDISGPAVVSGGRIIIGDMVDNNLTGILVEGTTEVAIGTMDGNSLNSTDVAVNISSGGAVVIRSFSSNLMPDGDLLISCGALEIDDVEDNALGDMVIDAASLNILAFEGNTLDDLMITTVGDIDVKIMHANTLANLTVHATVLNTNLTFNTMDVMDVNLSGGLAVDVMSVNTLTSLLVQASDVTIGTMEWNTLTDGVEVSAASVAMSVTEGNSMDHITINATDGTSVGTMSDNTLTGDIVMGSGGDIELESIRGNTLRHLHLNATSSLNISSMEGNAFDSVTGTAILLHADSLKITSLVNNTLQSGTPERFLMITGDSAHFVSVTGNTMNMASSSAAINVETASSLIIGTFSDNLLNGDVTLRSSAVGVNVIENNQMRSLSVTADILGVNGITGNDCVTDIVVLADLIGVIEEVSDNTMASFTIDTIGNLTITSFSANDCSGDMALSGNESVTIGAVTDNVALSLNVISDGMMTLGPVTGNAIGGVNFTTTALDIDSIHSNDFVQSDIVVSGECFIGNVVNNTIDSLNVSAADLTISSINDNPRLGTVALVCDHLAITDGVRGNHIPGGISIAATSAATLNITDNVIDAAGDGVSINITLGMTIALDGNVLSGCGLHGVNLQSAGIVQLSSFDDVIEAAEAAIMIRAGGDVELTITSLDAQGGVDIASTSNTVQILDSIISDGGGVSIVGPSSVGLVNVSLNGNLAGIHCPDNVMLTIEQSLFTNNTVGVNASGGNLTVNGSVFENNGLAVVVDSAAVTFEGNDVSDSGSDGLRIIGCDQVTVRNNSFTDNTGFAINASGCSDALLVWNEFRANNGATATYHADRAQCRDDGNNTWSASRFEGSGGTEGNYWSDWQSPDANGDGIVDDPYVLSGNAVDGHPLAGLSDVQAPYLTILTPEDGSNHSYDAFVLSWEAMDNRSGISLYGVEVLVDGVPYAVLPSDQTSLSIDPLELEEGVRNITVSVRDNDGNLRNVTITILVDRTPPSIVITHPSDGDVLTTPFDLQWDIDDGHDPAPRTDISWDGVSWTIGVTSPYQIDGLDDGEHTVHLRAVDHLGNENVTQVTFIVDDTPPVVVITSPAEGDSLNSSQVTISWTVDDDNLDSVAVTSNGFFWIQAQDDYTFTLGDGGHMLQVRATDKAGNVNVSVVNITVDTEPPWMEISSPSDGDHLDDGDVQMSFNVTDTDLLEVQVSLDGASWVSPDAADGHTFIGLDDGVVTLYLRAVDRAGNVNITSVSVTVDTVAPAVTITSPSSGQHINYISVPVEWDVIETSPFGAEVSLDGLTWSPSQGPLSHDFDLVGEGTHELWVRVTDAAGNADVTNVTVVVDLTAPQVTVTSPSDGSHNSTGTVHLTWDVAEVNGWTAAISIDGSPWQEMGQVTGHSVTDLEDGERTFRVKVTDEAGNHDIDSVTVNVDSNEPILAIVSPADGAYMPSEEVLVEWTVDDSSPVSTEVSDDGVTWSASDHPDNHTFNLVEGTNEVWVRSTDAAGNVNVSSISVVVDTVPPQLIITSPPDGHLSDADEVLVEWTVNESSPFSVHISYDNVTWTPSQNTFNNTFALEDGENDLYVRVTDAAGNSVIGTVTVNYAEPEPSLINDDSGNTTEIAVVATGALALGGAYLFLRPRRLL